MTPETVDIRTIQAMVRRRIKGFLLVFVLIVLAGAVVAVLLPPKYKSESTILIENQLIPTEYVQSTITGYVEQRIETITQQVMSRTRLQEIIDRFDLYRDMRQRYTDTEITDRMRKDIRLNMVSAEVRDTRTGRAEEATIAFTIGYEGENPAVVQRVANELASLYMELNLKQREERATTTTTFLQQELDGLRSQMDATQDALSAFKQAHMGELPEHNVVNLQAISRLTRDLENVTTQINQLQERKILLEGQIAGVDPMRPMVTSEGKSVMNPADQLRVLRLELMSLKSRYSAKHPDVVKLEGEIQELEAQVGSVDDGAAKVRRLEELTGELATLKGKLGPEHPDVIRLSREVDALSAEIQQASARKTGTALFEENPDNPAYIHLRTQIATTDAEIAAMKEQKARIQMELMDHQKRMANAPLVEQEYNRLLRDLESTRLKHVDLTGKLMEAQVAQGMEETQRGERFVIIDPAQLPEKPFKPNRIAILLISFVLAMGGAVGMAAVREALDTTVKSAEELAALTGVPVLSVIARMDSPQEIRRRWIKWGIIVLAVLALVGIGLYLFHEFVMPLEVFWAKVERRLLKMQVI